MEISRLNKLFSWHLDLQVGNAMMKGKNCLTSDPIVLLIQKFPLAGPRRGLASVGHR